MFTLDLLPGRQGFLPGPVEQGQKYFCHLTEPHAGTAMQQCFTVVPLREYDEVAASWKRRGMNPSILERQWRAMRALSGVHFLQIDAPDRDEQLARLSAALGVSLKTDWKPTNSVRQRPVSYDGLHHPRFPVGTEIA
jgi:hypothetical protein